MEQSVYLQGEEFFLPKLISPLKILSSRFWEQILQTPKSIFMLIWHPKSFMPTTEVINSCKLLSLREDGTGRPLEILISGRNLGPPECQAEAVTMLMTCPMYRMLCSITAILACTEPTGIIILA